MSYITLKCKNCGANMSLNTESHSATCNHCGSTFLISDILDEKDTKFITKLSPQDFEIKMLASDALKQGETCLFKCEYEKAEEFFKKAIELDDTNFRSYLGVVKAKTKNCNILPKDDDYLQYAHYALSLATGDELILVKSELSKIDLLERESKRQKRIFAENKKREEKNRKHKKEVSKFFSIIALFIFFMIGCFIFTCTFASDLVFDNPTGTLSINVDSYDELSKVLSNKKYLDYEINLTADIDCEENTITPCGTPTNAFTGSFNGNNHKISNLKINATNSNYAGIFGYTVMAEIRNLVLDKVSLNINSTPIISSTSAYGLLIGKAEVTDIINVEVKNSCTLTVNRDISYPTAIGGLVGSITNSCFVSKISCHPTISTKLTQIIRPAASYIGGVIGTSQGSIVLRTCSNSSISAIVSNTSYSLSDCYTSGIIGSILNPISRDVSNVNYNNFSGSITLTTSDIVKPKVSGIAYCNLRASKMLNNTFLYTSNNIVLNLSYLSYTKLTDFEVNEYFVDFCFSNDDYLARLSIPFAGWEFSNTFEPNIG